MREIHAEQPSADHLDLDPQDGVTKFTAHHTPGPLIDGAMGPADALLQCRAAMYRTRWIGLDPQRYDGAGYGNISARLPDSGDGAGPPFVITGTGTGAIEALGPDDLCVVDDFELDTNSVWSRGPAAPSSESMTHGALYRACPQIRAIVHIHCPALWARGEIGPWVNTAPGVAYGTPEMGREMIRLVRAYGSAGIIRMTGHLDGFLAYGPDLPSAALALKAIA